MKQRQKPHKPDRTPRWRNSSRTLRHTTISHEDPKIVRSAQLRHPALAYVPIVGSTHSRADMCGGGRTQSALSSNAASSLSRNWLRSRDGRPQPHSHSRKDVRQHVRLSGTRSHPQSCDGWRATPRQYWMMRTQIGQDRMSSWLHQCTGTGEVPRTRRSTGRISALQSTSGHGDVYWQRNPRLLS